LRIYNLSKTARDDLLLKLGQVDNLKPRDLKIAEGDSKGDFPVIFDKEQNLYLGRKKLGSGEEITFPLLRDEKILPTLPIITVDSGAVKFVCNGANIMRPGITRTEGDFDKGTFVVVKEQKYGKAIAVGRTIISKSELEALTKGQVVENLHYAGDQFWESLKEIDSTSV
jgi:predicted RNA-binding protein (TIGR00451 family)